jgi:hypothetical protein
MIVRCQIQAPTGFDDREDVGGPWFGFFAAQKDL